MVNEKLKNFLSSTAMVIDDEIFEDDSSVLRIINELEKNGTLFVKRDSLLDSYDSVSNLSFIILDWDLKTEEEKLAVSMGVSIGATLSDDKKNNNKIFIKNIISKFFIPIFIFSQENVDLIKSYLENDEIIKDAINKGRIFLCDKSNLEDDQVITSLNKWLNESMTVYTYKIIEESIEKAKHRFFNEMHSCDPSWPCHVYQTLKTDAPADINSDFQEFLMTSYTSTIEPIQFNSSGFDKTVSLSETEILKIYSKIKFFSYKEDWEIGPHTGDIYRLNSGDQNEYYINISASCDMRKDNFYFVKGKSVDEVKDKNYLYTVQRIINENAICFDFTKVKIKKIKPNVNELLIGDKPNKKTYKRVGRLLSPYIDALQEKYSYYITRTGVCREP